MKLVQQLPLPAFTRTRRLPHKVLSLESMHAQYFMKSQMPSLEPDHPYTTRGRGRELHVLDIVHRACILNTVITTPAAVGS